jgi:two-component system cell cycle response regulator
VRVLIADDDPASRALLRAMVTQLGHECLVTGDGARAWQLLAQGGIDVLFTDWMMPGVDGPELCRLVRHGLDGGYIYIVLTAGNDYPERVLEGMSAGADDYLTKPVNASAVQARLVAAERITLLHSKLAMTQAELERVNLDLLEQTRTDELTGLGNRRRMEEDLARVHARAVRVERSYGVALFDIDHFKLYNDHYGHVAGDEALRQIAHRIELVVRTSDCCYRFGGEEFLLLVQDCDFVNSLFAAGERVRQAVVDARIPHESRPSDPPVATVSGGVAAWTPGSKTTARDVIAWADEALYRAKESGRNRIQVARATVLGADAVAVAR